MEREMVVELMDVSDRTGAVWVQVKGESEAVSEACEALGGRWLPKARVWLVPVTRSPELAGQLRALGVTLDVSGLRRSRVEKGMAQAKAQTGAAKSEAADLGGGWAQFLAEPPSREALIYDLGDRVAIRVPASVEARRWREFQDAQGSDLVWDPELGVWYLYNATTGNAKGWLSYFANLNSKVVAGE